MPKPPRGPVPLPLHYVKNNFSSDRVRHALTRQRFSFAFEHADAGVLLLQRVK